MNEKIKELALKAMTYVTHNPKANKLNSGDMFDEKFAELIVQECVVICQDIDGEDNIDARSGRQDCAVEIKKHFGV